MSTSPTAPPPPPIDDNALLAERREKLAAIRARGVAFPNDFKPKDRAAELARRHGHLENESLEPMGVAVSIAGRLMLKRVMGKASFATVQDATGRIQLRVSVDAIGDDALRTSSSTSTSATSSAPRARSHQEPRPAS